MSFFTYLKVRNCKLSESRGVAEPKIGAVFEMPT